MRVPMFQCDVVSISHSFIQFFICLFNDFAQTLFSCKNKYQILTPTTIIPRESTFITLFTSIKDFNPRCLMCRKYWTRTTPLASRASMQPDYNIFAICLVGVRGLEPPISTSQMSHDNRFRYTPIYIYFFILLVFHFCPTKNPEHFCRGYLCEVFFLFTHYTILSPIVFLDTAVGVNYVTTSFSFSDSHRRNSL